MVRKLLSDEQKECHKKLYLDPLQCNENERHSLNSIAACNENWVFTYDPETTHQSMQLKKKSSPTPKKSCTSPSKFKAMLIVFFDIFSSVMADGYPTASQ
jgi:hypothetical protein